MKKFYAILVSFALLTSTAIAGAFPDVAEDNLNYNAIQYLSEKEVISGYPDGNFKPDVLVNRAEALKIITLGIGIKHDEQYDVLFPDVKEDDWYFSFVMGAQKEGVVNGYPDGTFKPADNINSAEALKMVVLASKASIPKSVSEDVFIDVSKDSWYAPYALYARNNNLILPDKYGKLRPEKYITRAEFAELMYRMMIVIEKGGPFPLHSEWPYYESSKLPFKMKYDDKNWQIIENENEVIFFRPDDVNFQFSPVRIYPNSAVINVIVDENKNSFNKNDYFSNIKTIFSGAKYTEFKVGDFDALEVLYSEKRIVDWYVYLGNGRVLALYTEFGNGPLGYQLKQFIKSMMTTLEYREVTAEAEDYSKLLSDIFAIVLVEGKGMEMLDKLPDKLIINTDTIGVGTGPVDYYYSENLNYTFKYERASDVILDTKEGNTSAF